MTAALLFLALQSQAPIELQAYARMSHPPLAEVSGMVASQRYEGVYWVHNDSGDSPRIFAIDENGKAILPDWVSDRFWVDSEQEGKEVFPGISIASADNSDWEAIALDGDTLYLCDVGNNGNARRDLGIYAVTEPNPHQTISTRALKWIPVQYPDQSEFPGRIRHFDCEAVFAHEGALYFITKHRAPDSLVLPVDGAKLYRLTALREGRMNTLTLLDSVENLGGWVTAADVSPDGKWVAILCQAPVQSIWLYPADRLGLDFFDATPRRIRINGGRQCEAIAFTPDGRNLIVANEQRDLFRIPVALD